MSPTIDTDCFQFAKQDLCKVLSANLPEEKTRTQNIIECKDDVLFGWNSRDCTVLSLNWRAAKATADATIKYQTLVPSSPQNYNVEKITASHEGSFLALSGSRGTSILELPRRWGRHGQFHEGKEKIICRSYNLDERLFINNIHLEVLQVRWHPASPKDSILLVLLSNNSIRVYDESTLRHVWRIGPIPCAVPSTGNKHLPYLDSLGDTAVDFDIAPPRVVKSNNIDDIARDVSGLLINETSSPASNKKDLNSGRVEWPLIVLRGNGSLYVVLIGLDTEKPHIQGPLSMFPGTNDNYGTDSCAIVVLPSLPPTIVIAESSGKLHHAILMESEVAEQSYHEIDASLTIYPSEWIVHVLETVELELGMSEAESNTGGKNSRGGSFCPIFLKRDLIDESRYFAYHNTGLHAITVKFVRQLQNFVECDDTIENTNLLSSASHAEYLVCTKALDSKRINPVLGFTLLQSPSGLFLLLGSGQVVTLSLISDPNVLRELQQMKQCDLSKSTSTTKLTSIFSESFEAHIKNILSAEVSRPIFKLDRTTEPTSKEALEFLMHSTQVLREQYFIKHDRAIQEIQKRVNILQLLKEQQKEEIAQLQVEKERIRRNAERLAEMYEDISDKQQILFRRAQEVVRLATINVPNAGMAEHDFQQSIEKIATATRTLAASIGNAKKKVGNQENQINYFNVDNRTKKVVLLPKMENTIKDIISEMTVDIDSQIKEIKKIKTNLNME